MAILTEQVTILIDSETKEQIMDVMTKSFLTGHRWNVSKIIRLCVYGYISELQDKLNISAEEKVVDGQFSNE